MSEVSGCTNPRPSGLTLCIAMHGLPGLKEEQCFIAQNIIFQLIVSASLAPAAAWRPVFAAPCCFEPA